MSTDTIGGVDYNVSLTDDPATLGVYCLNDGDLVLYDRTVNAAWLAMQDACYLREWC